MVRPVLQDCVHMFSITILALLQLSAPNMHCIISALGLTIQVMMTTHELHLRLDAFKQGALPRRLESGASRSGSKQTISKITPTMMRMMWRHRRMKSNQLSLPCLLIILRKMNSLHLHLLVSNRSCCHDSLACTEFCHPQQNCCMYARSCVCILAVLVPVIQMLAA